MHKPKPLTDIMHVAQHEQEFAHQIRVVSKRSEGLSDTHNGIIVFICTDACLPICIFLYESGQNESVQLKPIGSL